VRIHEVEDPLLEVVKHADLHCVEEVGPRDVAHNTGNGSIQFGSSVNMVGRAFGISGLAVVIAVRSISVVILSAVVLVMIHIISKFVLWTLAPIT